MDISNNNDIVKIEWETVNEYNYRIGTGRIIKETAKSLDKVTKFQKSSYEKIKGFNDFTRLKNKLNELIVPEIYNNIHDYLINMNESYYKASNQLILSIKDQCSVSAYKAGRFILKGNAWMEIAKAEIHEVIEDVMKKRSSKI